MAGAKVNLVGYKRLQDKYKKLGKAWTSGPEFRRTVKKVLVLMWASVNKTFKKQGRPKWKALKEKTAKRRRKGKRGGRSHMILLDTGRLKRTVTATGPNSVFRQKGSVIEFGTNLKYGPTHQFGDRSRKIPKREFLKIYDEDRKAINRVIATEFKMFDARNRVKAKP